MLGVALTAQRAGWGGGPPKFASRSQVTADLFGSAGDGKSVLDNDWTSPDFGNNISMSFDSTGLGSNFTCVYSATLWVGAEADLVWNTDQYNSNYAWIKTVNNDTSGWTPWQVVMGGNTGPIYGLMSRFGRKIADDTVTFLWEYGGYSIFDITGLYWADIAERWITVTIATSSTTTTFAGWSGGSVGSGNNAGRVVVTDATTGGLLKSKDFVVSIFNPTIPDPSAVTIEPYWNFNLNYGQFYTQTPQGGTGGADRTLLRCGGGWFSLGDAVDPLAADGTTGIPLYRYFSGQARPETIGGSRAWVNWYPVSTGTDGTDDLLYRLGPGRTSQATDIYARVPTSYHTTPLLNDSRP